LSVCINLYFTEKDLLLPAAKNQITQC